jgi:hypothetical protein
VQSPSPPATGVVGHARILAPDSRASRTDCFATRRLRSSLTARGGELRAFWCHASLSHEPPENFRTLQSAAHSQVTPGARQWCTAPKQHDSSARQQVPLHITFVQVPLPDPSSPPPPSSPPGGPLSSPPLTHEPLLHVSSSEQHCPLQSTSIPQLHPPPMHVWSALQVIPQPPQLEESLVVSTQEFTQAVPEQTLQLV